jgi:hypothetical protein
VDARQAFVGKAEACTYMGIPTSVLLPTVCLLPDRIRGLPDSSIAAAENPSALFLKSRDASHLVERRARLRFEPIHQRVSDHGHSALNAADVPPRRTATASQHYELITESSVPSVG